MLGTNTDISAAAPYPIAKPIKPPKSDSTTASTKNCSIIKPGVAPNAFKVPITRVRSVTETSMIFITPIPPTTRLIPTIPAVIAVALPVNLSILARAFSAVSNSKSSSSPSFSLCNWRKIRRILASTCASLASSFKRNIICTLVSTLPPSSALMVLIGILM